ncbi:hypothetical protein [Prosthecobacter sp.]|jgi:hypothetical protein|uniref:hypothetical protein n=1 Tax=Prosthecobacter sp. TaxID=1965333 RepID=UPI0037834DD1
MKRTTKPRLKAAAIHPAPSADATPRPIVSLATEGFKPITLDQLGLTTREMEILAAGARQLFPSDEETSTS